MCELARESDIGHWERGGGSFVKSGSRPHTLPAFSCHYNTKPLRSGKPPIWSHLILFTSLKSSSPKTDTLETELQRRNVGKQHSMHCTKKVEKKFYLKKHKTLLAIPAMLKLWFHMLLASGCHLNPTSTETLPRAPFIILRWLHVQETNPTCTYKAFIDLMPIYFEITRKQTESNW